MPEPHKAFNPGTRSIWASMSEPLQHAGQEVVTDRPAIKVIYSGYSTHKQLEYWNDGIME
jgi:hypothetical protein